MSNVRTSRRPLSTLVRASLSAGLLSLAMVVSSFVALDAPAGAAVPSVDLHPVCPDEFPGFGSPCPAVLPSAVLQGTTTPIVVHGSGFASAGPLTVWFSDSAITVGAPIVVSDSVFVAVVTVGSQASLGGAIIHVKNNDGESFCTSCGPTVL